MVKMLSSKEKKKEFNIDNNNIKKSFLSSKCRIYSVNQYVTLKTGVMMLILLSLASLREITFKYIFK